MKNISQRLIRSAVVLTLLVALVPQSVAGAATASYGEGAGLAAFGGCAGEGSGLGMDAGTSALTLQGSAFLFGLDGGGSWYETCTPLVADATGTGPSCLGYGGSGGTGRIDTEAGVYLIDGLSWAQTAGTGAVPQTDSPRPLPKHHFVALGQFQLYRDGVVDGTPDDAGRIQMEVILHLGVLPQTGCGSPGGVQRGEHNARIALLP